MEEWFKYCSFRFQYKQLILILIPLTLVVLVVSLYCVDGAKDNHSRQKLSNRQFSPARPVSKSWRALLPTLTPVDDPQAKRLTGQVELP